MFKQLVLCFTVLSLICAIQCTPTPVKRGQPSSKPEARGLPSPKPGVFARSLPSPKPGVFARSLPSPKPGFVPRGQPSSKPDLVARGQPSSKPDVVARGQPSAKPEGLAARGLCDFECPYESVAGKTLSRSSMDSGRLYCRYDVEETDDKAFCMYKRNTGELLSSSSPLDCDEHAVFHCPGTKSTQEEMKWVPEQPKDSRSVNLPQFVKARSLARRATEANAV